MQFEPVDRLPRWEWAMWWDETITRWHSEGLPREFRFSQVIEIAQHFGLDPYQQFWFSTTEATIKATQHHVEGLVASMDDYRALLGDRPGVAAGSPTRRNALGAPTLVSSSGCVDRRQRRCTPT